MSAYIHNPIVAGVITGLLSAAATDFQAFKSWHNFDDARKYSWGVALWRWFQGAIVGGVSAAGLGLM